VKKKNLFAKINIGLFILLIAFFLYVLLVPAEPLKINNIKVEGTSFKAGGEMKVVIDRCKYVDASVPGTASRYFVNAADPTKPDIFLSSTDDLGDKGCAVVNRTIDIPSHIKDGVYKIKFITRYYPSILREPVTIEYIAPQEFTIQGQELSTQLNDIYQQLQAIQLRTNAPITPMQSQTSNTMPLVRLENTQVPIPQPEPTPPAANPSPQPASQGGILQATISGLNNLIRGIL